MKILRMQLLPHVLPALGRGLSNQSSQFKKNLSRHFMFYHCQPMRNHHTEQLKGGNGKMNSEKVFRAVVFNPTCVSICNLSMIWRCAFSLSKTSNHCQLVVTFTKYCWNLPQYFVATFTGCYAHHYKQAWSCGERGYDITLAHPPGHRSSPHQPPANP